MSKWEFQDGGVEREPRAGRERTPAIVHYQDIIPAYGDQWAAGLDIIIDSTGAEPHIEQRLTDQNGREVERV